MKNFIKATAFCLIFLLLLLPLSQLFRPKDNTKEAGARVSQNHQKAAAISSIDENTIDLLFLGDSESYSSFIPMELWKEYGITSYNMGTSAQRLSETLTYLNLALKTQKPSILVMETNAVFRRVSPEQSWYSFLSESIPAVKYHDRWKNLNKQDLHFQYSSTYKDLMRGYYFQNKVKAGKVPEKYQKEDDGLKYVHFMNRLYMKAIKAICEKNGVRLCLVTCPSTKSWSSKKHNSAEALAEELDVLYLDMNVPADKGGDANYSEYCIDWKTDSRDGGDHLNYEGALKVTTWFGIWLNDRIELPDHRQDPRYEVWNADYLEYEKKVSED